MSKKDKRNQNLAEREAEIRAEYAERDAKAQASNIPGFEAPTIDPIFDLPERLDFNKHRTSMRSVLPFRGEFVSLDADGGILRLVVCRSEQLAERYLSHADPEHARTVSAAELLTERLWSTGSRERVARLMLRPIEFSGRRETTRPDDSGTPPIVESGPVGWTTRMSLQAARQHVARELIVEFRDETAALPVLRPREVSERGSERIERQRAAEPLEAFERRLAEELEKPRARRRFFGAIVDRMATEFTARHERVGTPPKQEADPWVERFGESREDYQARLAEAGLKPERIAKRVANMEAQLGGAS